MRKLYIIIAAVFFLSACKEEDLSKEYDAGKFEYVGINASPLPTSLAEGNGTASSSVNISVRYGNDVKPGRDIVVNIGLSGAGVLGTDFNITGVNSLTASGFSVTIPADTSVVTFTLTTIPNTATQDDRAVIMQVASSSPELSLGYPYSARYNLVIADDDCPYDLEDDFSGTADAYEVYAASTYGPYDPLITYVNSTTLAIGNIYDSGFSGTITLNPTDNSVTLAGTPGQSGFGVSDWVITGTGTLSPCTGEIVMSVELSSASFPYSDSWEYRIEF